MSYQKMETLPVSQLEHHLHIHPARASEQILTYMIQHFPERLAVFEWRRLHGGRWSSSMEAGDTHAQRAWLGLNGCSCTAEGGTAPWRWGNSINVILGIQNGFQTQSYLYLKLEAIILCFFLSASFCQHSHQTSLCH